MLFPIFLTTSGRLGSGQVGDAHLFPGSVWSGKLGSGSVVGSAGGAWHVGSGSLGGFDFGSGAVLFGQLGSGAAGSGNLGSGQVGQFHIGSGAVTSGRLGVTGDPASGCVLQANFSWVAQTGGTWKRLATATASSSATVDFTGLSSSHAVYLVVLSHVAPATDATEFWMRTSADNGSSYDAGANDYAWAYHGVNHNGAGADTADNLDSQIEFIGNVGNATNEYVSGIVEIYNPSAAKHGQIHFRISGVTSAAIYYFRSGFGRRISANSINAIRFLFSSGNIASGRFDLYGLAT